jgi:hypothetical protein
MPWVGENGRFIRKVAGRAILPLLLLSSNGELPQSILSQGFPSPRPVAASELKRSPEQAQAGGESKKENADDIESARN